MENAPPFNSQQDSGDEANDIMASINTQTDLHRAVMEYLKVEYDDHKLNTIHAILQSGEISKEVLESEKENLFEIVCRIKPPWYGNININIDRLLDIFVTHGIDLNDRNKNGETFLMRACKYKHIVIVESLLKMALRGFVLDIDAVDNSGETALMKAKENEVLQIVAAILILKLIYALEDKNEDIIRSVLDEFTNTTHIFEKSRSFDQIHDYVKKEEARFDIWIGALIIAMDRDTKHSEEILKLLLDDEILLNIEAEIGYRPTILHRLVRYRWRVDDDKKLRLIEMLLESGKINVNSINEEGYTALHLTQDEKLTSLLIRYGAVVNKKDYVGKTPLMPSIGLSVSVLQSVLLKETGTLVDLNAMDCGGQTALMHAVKLRNPDVVKLLLDAGASVNLSDHLGFTALHYTFCVDTTQLLVFPRNSEELKKGKEMAIFFDAEKPQHCSWYERNEEWSEQIMEIVEMLLQKQDIDVNALSFEKLSPLDIAEGCIPEIPPSIKNALKEKGAVLNVFRQIESPSTSDFHFDVRCRWILQRIVHAVSAADGKCLDFLKDRLRALIETFKEQIVSGKDKQGRTALHLVAISLFTFGHESFRREFSDSINDLRNTIVKELIAIGCNVNETDIFDRTPLHYANYILKGVLTSYAADESIRDKDRKRATDEILQKCLPKAYDIMTAIRDRYGKMYFLRLMNNKQMQINAQHVDTQDRPYDDWPSHENRGSEDGNSASEFWQKEMNLKTAPRLLWEECEYAFRHPLFKQITKEVIDLIDAVAKEIERLDPRFEIRVDFVGSSNEGTKLDEPNEFDFNCVLTKISELCEVSLSPELPTGFVRLKRKPTKAGETKQIDFESVFREDGILDTKRLNWQFKIILHNALVNIESRQSFGWNLDIFPLKLYLLDKVINIEMIKPLNSTSVNRISIDIVPCIHVDGYWPDDAISNVSEKIKTFGCNLVFDIPQKLYPWVPYSESCARISFSKAESDMIKESCDNAREAYMIGKTLVENSCLVSKYNLKNCLLYCIEALSPSSEKASQLGLNLEELDRQSWLRCLMKCHLEFAFKVSCPCYFMPNFYLPILKIHDMETGFPDLCEKAYMFYRCASNDTSESCCQFPAPDPLWERFDRTQLMATLSEIAYK